MNKSKRSIYKYYLYVFCIQMRLTRIVNILYLIQVINISLVEYTLLQSIFSMTQFALEIPSGIMGDYFRKKTITIWGLILSILAQVIISSNFIFDSKIPFFGLAIAFAIEGIGRAFISGADDALFFEKIRDDGYEDDYDKIRGKSQLVSSISLGVATFLGATIYGYNNKLPYLGQCVLSLIAIITIISVVESKTLLVHKVNEEKKHNKIREMMTKVAEVKKSYQVIFMVCFVSIIFGVINTVFGILPDYMSDIGFSSSQNGIVFMILSLLGGFVATQSYRFSKWGYGKLVLLTSIMMSVSVLFVWVNRGKFLTFIGLMLLYVIIDVLDPIAMKMFNTYVSDNIRATFLSFVSFLTAAMTMIIYPVSGVIVQNYGMISLLIIIALITIPMLTISYLLFKMYERKGNSDRIC